MPENEELDYVPEPLVYAVEQVNNTLRTLTRWVVAAILAWFVGGIIGGIVLMHQIDDNNKRINELISRSADPCQADPFASGC